MSFLQYIKKLTGKSVPVDEDNPLPVKLSGGDTINVSVGPSVEIANDSGNPIPVNAAGRSALGRATLTLTTSAVALSNTGAGGIAIPASAVAALIQADGGTVRLTLGTTDPTDTVGIRLDDGQFFPLDTSLANVRVRAQTGTCRLQVSFFDRA